MAVRFDEPPDLLQEFVGVSDVLDDFGDEIDRKSNNESFEDGLQ